MPDTSCLPMPSLPADARRASSLAPHMAPSVLLVDDEVVVRAAMRRFFARAGWTVSEATDGDAARRILEPNAAREFDLVICDLRMARVSGEELYRWILARRPVLASRVVFSSGDVESPETARFLAETGRPVLSKPFDLGALARIADEVRALAVRFGRGQDA